MIVRLSSLSSKCFLFHAESASFAPPRGTMTAVEHRDVVSPTKVSLLIARLWQTLVRGVKGRGETIVSIPSKQEPMGDP